MTQMILHPVQDRILNLHQYCHRAHMSFTVSIGFFDVMGDSGMRELDDMRPSQCA